MEAPLQNSERKFLRNLLKQGYSFFGAIAGITIILYFASAIGIIGIIEGELILIIGISAALLIGWLINKNYWIDLRNGEKIINIETVSDKSFKNDHVPGSQRVSPNFEMKEIQVFYLIINSYQYTVKQDLWDSVSIGEKVELHFAPKSKELLLIQKA